MDRPERGPGDAAAELALPGRGTSPGEAAGPLLPNRPDLDPRRTAGCILVAERASPEDVGRIAASAATVTLGGALLSHVARLSREHGKPSVTLDAATVPGDDSGALRVEAGNAGTLLLRAGDIAAVDGDEGVLRVPGGRETPARDRVRALWAALVDRDDPAARLERLRTLRSDPALVRFALEAIAVYRVVPTGEPARRALAALVRGHRARDLDPMLEDLCAKQIIRASRTAGRLAAFLERSVEPVAAGRRVEDAVRAIERRRDAVRLLGGPAESLDAILDEVRGAADTWRGVVGGKLAREVGRALELDEPALLRESGKLRGLVAGARRVGVDPDAVASLERGLARTVDRHRTRLGGRMIVDLDDPGVPARELVGGKAAGLFRMRPLLPEGCAIPPGFVLTTVAHRLHLAAEAEGLARCLRPGRDAAVRSRRARALVLALDPPPPVVEALRAGVARLLPSRLAIRSSSTVEDGPAGSLAGQLDTYLGVGTADEALACVRRCWASLWGPAVLAALEASGIAPAGAAVAVLVQPVVDTLAAGVLLTRDAEDDPETLLVNAAWGLGEAVSGGELQGDVYRVRRADGATLSMEIARDRTRIGLDPDRAGTRETALPAELVGRPCLGETDLGRLAALARAVEDGFGEAREVEFGLTAEGTLMLFQIRAPAVSRGAPRD